MTAAVTEGSKKAGSSVVSRPMHSMDWVELGPSLKVSSDKENQNICVFLQGEIIHDNTLGARDYFVNLIDSGYTHITVDMSGVNYIHSHGVGLLCLVQKLITAKSGTFVLHSLPENLKYLFETMGLSETFTIYDTSEEARRALEN